MKPNDDLINAKMPDPLPPFFFTEQGLSHTFEIWTRLADIDHQRLTASQPVKFDRLMSSRFLQTVTPCAINASAFYSGMLTIIKAYFSFYLLVLSSLFLPQPNTNSIYYPGGLYSQHSFNRHLKNQV
jgi:hypothetical protein